MKKLVVLGAVVFSLGACKSSTGWSSAEKKVFINTCVSKAQSSAQMTSAQATDYCSCMADKVEKKYPNAATADKMSVEEITEMAKACLK
jgi:hypothetical protein